MLEEQVTAVYFADGRPWRNLNGDWLDSLGIAQGDTPYGGIPSQGVFTGAARPIAVDITMLARMWVGNGNRGLLLRKGPIRRWASRNHSDPALQPHVVINGERRECTADSELDRGAQTMHLGLRQTIDTYGGELEVQRAALQFDTSGITRVESAMLHLVELRAEGRGTVEIYQLDPPPSASRTEKRGIQN